MKLSIIIVNYNNPHLIEKCLESILTSSISFPYEIIVVDNASIDKFKGQGIKESKNKDNKLTSFQVINNKENVGSEPIKAPINIPVALPSIW